MNIYDIYVYIYIYMAELEKRKEMERVAGAQVLHIVTCAQAQGATVPPAS